MHQTLDQLTDYLTKSEIVDETLDKANAVTIYSGAIKAEGDPIPGLFASEEHAKHAWFHAFADYQSKFKGMLGDARTRMRWIDRPEMEKYQITMMDSKGTHRVVADRYTVRSRVVIDYGQQENRENRESRHEQDSHNRVV